jgi:hypothetical protein
MAWRLPQFKELPFEGGRIWREAGLFRIEHVELVSWRQGKEVPYHEICIVCDGETEDSLLIEYTEPVRQLVTFGTSAVPGSPRCAVWYVGDDLDGPPTLGDNRFEATSLPHFHRKDRAGNPFIDGPSIKKIELWVCDPVSGDRRGNDGIFQLPRADFAYYETAG